jgi:hypothetical protein
MVLNKSYQAFPGGMSGGLNTFVVSGVVEGCALALAGTAGNGIQAGAGNEGKLQVTVAPGVIRLDGKQIHIAAAITANITSAVANLSSANTEVDVYLIPTRKVNVVTAMPSNGTGANGDQSLLCTLVEQNALSYGSYYICDRILQKKAGVWVDLDPIKDIKNDSIGWLGAPLNNIALSVSASNFVGVNELPVFLNQGLPPHLSVQGLPLIRQSAGIKLGKVKFVSGVASIVETLPEYQKLPL